jgi:AcrR family transcriptional regulator
MEAVPRVRRKRAYHHGDLREALIQAAFLLAQRGGPDAVTLRAVARRAGVSEAAPYHHFSDKRALLAMAASVGFEALDARLLASLEDVGDDPGARLAAFAGAYVAFALEEPGPFRLMFGAHVAEQDLASLPEAAIPGRRVKARVRALAHAAVASIGQGPGKRAPLDPETLFQMIWASSHGWAWLVAEKELDPRGAEAPDAQRAISLAEDAVLRIVGSFRAEGEG